MWNVEQFVTHTHMSHLRMRTRSRDDAPRSVCVSKNVRKYRAAVLCAVAHHQRHRTSISGITAASQIGSRHWCAHALHTVPWACVVYYAQVGNSTDIQESLGFCMSGGQFGCICEFFVRECCIIPNESHLADRHTVGLYFFCIHNIWWKKHAHTQRSRICEDLTKMTIGLVWRL